MILTDQGPLSLEAMFDRLNYAAYVANRERSPEISPESWAKILPNVPAMERKFQEERKAA